MKQVSTASLLFLLHFEGEKKNASIYVFSLSAFSIPQTVLNSFLKSRKKKNHTTLVKKNKKEEGGMLLINDSL